MALVWFVDKSPRSRKPVQYKRLDDFKGPIPEESADNDLLPVLMPCALCSVQQQLTTSLSTVPAPIKAVASIQRLFFKPLHHGAFQ